MLLRCPVVSVDACRRISSATFNRKSGGACPQYWAPASSSAGNVVTRPQSRKQSCKIPGICRRASHHVLLALAGTASPQIRLPFVVWVGRSSYSIGFPDCQSGALSSTGVVPATHNGDDSPQ